MEYSGVNIEWLGHSAFRITKGKTIYIDPYNIKPAAPADLILITHEHFDHCSIEDVQKILKGNTTIITTPAAKDKLRSLWEKARIETIRPGQSYDVDNVRVEAVPAVNTNKFRSPGVPYHSEKMGGVGFVIEIAGVRIYHAGDTDMIPEMAKLEVDVALLPVGGKYTMNASEAAEAVNLIRPGVAVPMHWGDLIGTRADAEAFQKASKVPVVILEKTS